MYFIWCTHRSGTVTAHYSITKQKRCYNITIQHNQTDFLSTLYECHRKFLVFFATENKAGRGNILNFFVYKLENVKGKAVALQVRSSPEGSRKLRLPDFMTTAQDGGKVVSLTHRPPSFQGNTSGNHFC